MNYILGFGVSALGFVSALKTTKNITILEKNSYSGGHSYSHEFNGFYFDEGTHISHSKDEKFLKKILLNLKYKSKYSKVLNYSEGNWFDYPIHNNLINFHNKLDYLHSFLSREETKKPLNFQDWCINNYGNKITNDFYKKYTKKYWNKNLKDLDTSWTTGRVFNSKEDKVILNTFFKNKDKVSTFDKFRYPNKNGFYGFFKKKFESYKSISLNNIKIKKIDLRNKIISTDFFKKEYQNIFSTIPIPELPNYINFPKKIIKCINSLEFTSLYTLNIIINKKIDFNHDWNYIYDEATNISRVTILNNTNQSNSNRTAIQAEIFELGNRRKKFKIDNEIKFLAKILNFKKNEVIFKQIKFIKYSYIISKKTNQQNVKKIKEYLSKYNIYLFGLYGDWIYYWSDQAYNKGEELCKKFLKNRYI